jgi:flagellar hook protein FlgE
MSEGDIAEESTKLVDLDQFSGSLTSGEIAISGFDHNGDALSSGLSFAVDSSTTLKDFVDHLNNNVLDNATASLTNGQVRVTDDVTGYSKLDMKLEYSDTNGDGTSLKTPGYFELSSVGGKEVKNVNITVYDSQGGKHVLSGAFVRTPTPNKWDMILSSITGDIADISFENRRIENITFNSKNGAFEGIEGTDSPEFEVTFGFDGAGQKIGIEMGTPGQFDGITQFAGNSTAVAREQNGYEAGRLSGVSVDNAGTLIGSFSNGVKKDIAQLQIALFQNDAGLESVGDGYYAPSANSGEAIATQAMSGGAGTIHGSSLEKSNADVASEFVNLIEAQNGFQANARTIQVANDVLKELTNLIR